MTCEIGMDETPSASASAAEYTESESSPISDKRGDEQSSKPLNVYFKLLAIFLKILLNAPAFQMSPGAVKLRSWLNKSLRIQMSDGRVLIGVFLCTDRDANVILGSCSEYLPEETNVADAASSPKEEPRMLGLVMVPGKHIVSVSVDKDENYRGNMSSPLTHHDLNTEEIM